MSIVPARPGAVPTPLVYPLEFPAYAGKSINRTGTVPRPAVLVALRVYMELVHTLGTYTLVFTNVETGQTLLAGASFDMGTLSDDTWTEVTLTGSLSDKTFSPNDRWRVTMTANATFNGQGIEIEPTFEAVE
jgi:hypothetical protein